MPKHWKSFIKKEVTENIDMEAHLKSMPEETSSESEMSKEAFRSVVQENTTLKSLLDEQESLQNEMKRLTGHEDTTTNVHKNYQQEIKTIPQKRREEQQWVEKKERQLRTFKQKKKENDTWLSQKQKKPKEFFSIDEIRNVKKTKEVFKSSSQQFEKRTEYKSLPFFAKVSKGKKVSINNSTPLETFNSKEKKIGEFPKQKLKDTELFDAGIQKKKEIKRTITENNKSFSKEKLNESVKRIQDTIPNDTIEKKIRSVEDSMETIKTTKKMIPKVIKAYQGMDTSLKKLNTSLDTVPIKELQPLQRALKKLEKSPMKKHLDRAIQLQQKGNKLWEKNQDRFETAFHSIQKDKEEPFLNPFTKDSAGKKSLSV